MERTGMINDPEALVSPGYFFEVGRIGMDFMERALELAEQALGTTSPNPAVGAVLVKNGNVIGEGYTQPPGSAHAEIVALNQAGRNAAGASLYVTLEPCSHFGRTPPCTQAIIEAGVCEVHMSILDPNPLVGGKGKAQLEKAGIKTRLGERAAEAIEINEGFLKRITSGLPFVTAKWAMSLDGKIATRSGDSKWITGTMARTYGHYLRAINDAVLVGIGTALADDPELTVRLRPGENEGNESHLVWPYDVKQPLRVVLDSRGRIPLTAKVVDPAFGRAIVATTEAMEDEKRRALQDLGCEVLVLPDTDGKVDMRAVLAALAERDVNGVMIEGGGEILGSAIFAGLVDKVCAFIAPKVIGGNSAPSPVRGLGAEKMTDIFVLERTKFKPMGDDLLVTGYIAHSPITNSR